MEFDDGSELWRKSIITLMMTMIRVRNDDYQAKLK